MYAASNYTNNDIGLSTVRGWGGGGGVWWRETQTDRQTESYIAVSVLNTRAQKCCMLIFNESLTSGTDPSDFKTAVIKTLLKKPSLGPSKLKTTTPFEIYPFCQHFWKTCSLTVCIASVNTQSAQHPSVCLPVRAQHGDCSSPRTPLLTSLDDNISSL